MLIFSTFDTSMKKSRAGQGDGIDLRFKEEKCLTHTFISAPRARKGQEALICA